MDVNRFNSSLLEYGALRESDEICSDAVEHIAPKYAEQWPLELNPRVRTAFVRAGISKPFEHQAIAISKSLQGNDVVLESPTASGKTLAFTAPMLHSLVSHPSSHALMIYPMKALAYDQREQVEQFGKLLKLQASAYDGDTPKSERDGLRKNPPSILLTNPEFLNTSFLAWQDRWEGFLKRLRFIVIDEMHAYRGFFGGNMALLLRRFFLQLERIGSYPNVFLSTATCHNPVEHARNLTGRDVKLVSARDVLRPRRRYIFVKPDLPGHRYWDELRERVEQASLAALSAELQILVFCPSKSFLEDALRNCRRKAKEIGLKPNLVSGFHADLKGRDKKRIQRKLQSSEVSVVFSTNALELGLDVGGLDGVILAGFPSNLMSAWQQIGRAGRSWDKDAFVLFYSMNDPIDLYFVGNIQRFLDKPLDQLVIDPNNEALISKHIPSLITETKGKLYGADGNILGDAFLRAALKSSGKPARGRNKVQRRINLRGSIGPSFMLKLGDRELGQISEMRRFREAYLGAIFTFFGRKYRVRAHEEDAIILEDYRLNRRTEGRFFTTLLENEASDGRAWDEFEFYRGTITIQMNFRGYSIVDERSNETVDFIESNDARWLNNLHSFWISLPRDSINDASIGALEHLFRVGSLFVIPADRFDASTWSKFGGDATVAYHYENYPGGIGVARKLYDVWPQALEAGIKVATSCRCERGCQNCIEPAKSWDISNRKINKRYGVDLGNTLLNRSKERPTHKFQNGILVAL